MRFQTCNTTYTLIDCGDGAFLISGHEKYCPVPTLVRIDQPIEVGKRVLFRIVNQNNKPVITTPVLDIL